MEIDLWREVDKTAYEIILGDGAEIWKDILKAILVGASTLIVFCRHYPDTAMKGNKEIANNVRNLEKYLQGKLNVSSSGANSRVYADIIEIEFFEK